VQDVFADGERWHSRNFRITCKFMFPSTLAKSAIHNKCVDCRDIAMRYSTSTSTLQRSACAQGASDARVITCSSVGEERSSF
jgi:hypothetical protein